MLRSCVADILKIAKSFNLISFQHNSRDLNLVVHTLAKFCLRFDMDTEYFDSFSNWLVR